MFGEPKGKRTFEAEETANSLGLEHVTERRFKRAPTGIDRGCLRTGLVFDAIQVADNDVVGLIPCDAHEVVIPFGAHPFQGLGQAVLRVDNLSGVLATSTNHPQRMSRVRSNIDELAVIEADFHPTTRRAYSTDTLFPIHSCSV